MMERATAVRFGKRFAKQTTFSKAMTVTIQATNSLGLIQSLLKKGNLRILSLTNI
jgi:hypothetical protein